MTRLGLTPDQKRCLRVIEDYAGRGGVPTYDQIRVALGLSSKSGVNRLLVALEARGHITRKPGLQQSIALVAPAAPVAWLVAMDSPGTDALFMVRAEAETYAQAFEGVVHPLYRGAPVAAVATRADASVGATA